MVMSPEQGYLQLQDLLALSEVELLRMAAEAGPDFRDALDPLLGAQGLPAIADLDEEAYLGLDSSTYTAIADLAGSELERLGFNLHYEICVQLDWCSKKGEVMELLAALPDVVALILKALHYFIEKIPDAQVLGLTLLAWLLKRGFDRLCDCP